MTIKQQLNSFFDRIFPVKSYDRQLDELIGKLQKKQESYSKKLERTSSLSKRKSYKLELKILAKQLEKARQLKEEKNTPKIIRV
jgi:hypothetical protein